MPNRAISIVTTIRCYRGQRALSTLQKLKDASVAHHREHTHRHRDGEPERFPKDDDIVPWLAKQPRHPLSLGDLVKSVAIVTPPIP